MLLLFVAATSRRAGRGVVVLGKYAPEHDTALADIAAAGVSAVIAFTRSRAGAYDFATDRPGGVVVTTITGSAYQARGNPARYMALGLVLSTMPTLLFTPTAYGLRANSPEFVLPGDTVLWATQVFTVRDVDPVAPDGVVIMARIVVGK